MKNLFLRSAGILVLGFLLSMNAFSQSEGDYRSVAQGDWSSASTWEVYTAGSWQAAATAPAGTETITIGGEDTVFVDVAVSISGRVRATETGVLSVSTGSLEIADGGVYEHARNEGSVPTATWSTGSTIELTGVVDDAPGNSNQSYHHVVFNTPDLLSNEHMSLDEVTIGGDVTVVNTGSARWYLTSASPQDTSIVTIMGDVLVQDGQFAVQGTSAALSVFEVHHHGDIVVTGGRFAVSRGSQGSGSGTTTWFLYGGNLSVSNAAVQNSNPTAGNAAVVFAGAGTQQLTFDTVDYAGGDFHFEVSDSTTLQITQDFVANGQLLNYGAIDALGTVTFSDGAIYVHAQDGGTVPTAVWESGSTAMITGTVSSAPDNRGQDYFNLTLDTPGMLSNIDLSLEGRTIGGDITVLDSGSSRWRLVGGNSGSITIMGDLIVSGGSFETQGTGSATDVEVHHYGDVLVDGGDFSVSRGSQASGTGTTLWYLYAGDFSLANGQTRNSNPTPGNARFIFAAGDAQALTLGENAQIDNLSIEVSDSTTLDLGVSEIGGNGIFWLQDGATVSTAHVDGLDGNLQTTGEIVLGKSASFTYNGTVAQVAGLILPDTLSTLTVANAEGVALADTNYVAMLLVNEGATLNVDSTGTLTAAAGQVDGTVVNRGEVNAESEIAFGGTSTYEHARNAGSVPSGVWAEGSTLLMTGVVDEAPDNRNQSYHHVVFNSPGLTANRHMSLDEVTIGGDVRVIDTGSARWYLTSASPQDTSTVTIMGDVIVEGGQFSVQGTSSALTVFDVYHHGSVFVTGGNFSIARGSQSGTGSTTWYLYEGDFSMSGARTQNSNPGNAKFVFARDGVQQLTLGSDVDFSALPIEVNSGTTLDMGTSALGGNDLFTLNASATLATAHVDGVAGAIQTTGTVSLDTGASYVFNGTEAQVTSTLLPANVNDLVIDNEAGVQLTQETTVDGVLRLVAGVFDNTIPFALGPSGSISYEGGSLLTNVANEPEDALPTEFALYPNYPNPFNPSTVIRYDIKEPTEVTVTLYDVTGRVVRELVNGSHPAGRYQVEWNAGGHASGVYFYQIRTGDWTATRSLLLVK